MPVLCACLRARGNPSRSPAWLFLFVGYSWGWTWSAWCGVLKIQGLCCCRELWVWLCAFWCLSLLHGTSFAGWVFSRGLSLVEAFPVRSHFGSGWLFSADRFP
ncbi:hypothetical protein SUGI_0501900 [Cryptomeria japonica]|nr:hypothetical protein SUGI_0501900 [Cryptomeria japonica]